MNTPEMTGHQRGPSLGVPTAAGREADSTRREYRSATEEPAHGAGSLRRVFVTPRVRLRRAVSRPGGRERCGSAHRVWAGAGAGAQSAHPARRAASQAAPAPAAPAASGGFVCVGLAGSGRRWSSCAPVYARRRPGGGRRTHRGSPIRAEGTSPHPVVVRKLGRCESFSSFAHLYSHAVVVAAPPPATRSA
jgi:hypothetical protein